MLDGVRWRDTLPLRTVLGIAFLGGLGVGLAAYSPLWAPFPDPGLVQDAVAGACAALAVIALTLAWDIHEVNRTDPRRRPIPARARLIAHLGPSVEIYDPRGSVDAVPSPTGAGRSVEEDDDE